MVVHNIRQKTLELIDSLKTVCASYGLGNDGNEFKIITQVFLYKYLNDHFAHRARQLDPRIAEAENWEQALTNLPAQDYDMLCLQMGGGVARLKPQHFISTLYQHQRDDNFAQLFDDTLQDIAISNNEIFAVKTGGGAKITLFDRLSDYIADAARRDDFCRALINQLVEFSFEPVFDQGFDFYATIFEYLIKDYNSDAGGKYAEYYTPYAVAHIMANILVPPADRGQVRNVTVCDPAAGSGSLLMNVAHAIGAQKCSIYTQDISQKSSQLLRLNLILNGLVHSIGHVIQGNTLLEPFHKEGEQLRRFDYIVSNPPFKMDFSDWRDQLDSKANHTRFFAGIPNVPKKAKDKMAIYQLFVQHIIHTLKPGGKAAVVVPTGFLTAQQGVDKKIRQRLIDAGLLAGVVSMPSNIFATTGTNVSVVFMHDGGQKDAILIDASALGKKVKDGKNQKTVLSDAEEQRIIDTFNQRRAEEDFSVVASYESIAQKNYSFSAGQYFEVKIDYVDLTPQEFDEKMSGFSERLEELFAESGVLEGEIRKQLLGLRYEI